MSASPVGSLCIAPALSAFSRSTPGVVGRDASARAAVGERSSLGHDVSRPPSGAGTPVAQGPRRPKGHDRLMAIVHPATPSPLGGSGGS